ncbi:GDP/GTP exchange factor [Microdochium nivale]|nr:GDP/GTP exchange factor [Microdochium nivale]
MHACTPESCSSMEVDPAAAQPSPPARLTVNISRAPRRDLSVKSQRPPKLGSRESKRNKSPPLPTAKDKAKLPTTKSRVALVTSVKPLVPAAERRQPDFVAKPARKDADNEKASIVPDGASASREGRKFTVANVGNNGRIFLRPTVRPANQRYPQPTFVFPVSPPGTAGFEPKVLAQHVREDASALGSQLTAFSETPSPGVPLRKAYFEHRTSLRPGHRRAMSDSTIQESSMAHEGDTGAFKVIISKPQDELKSKTAEDIDVHGHGYLQIAFPSWKLGTPRFSTRGTPFIRGSSYAPTEEYRLSTNSIHRRSPLDRNSLHPDSVTPGIATPSESHGQFYSSTLLSPFMASFSPQARLPTPPRTTFVPTSIEITPAMFDELTFKPSCNDRSLVRLSPTSGAVTAATPARLVAEITSATFLDYELISDFFLSFRSFLEPAALLCMLVARFRWALAREDEVGTVVRVRTFVAMRHWLLNYFIDDFVVDYQLRVSFCSLINDFVSDLVSEGKHIQPPMKIVAELKKCWRRICAQYWDGPEFDAMLGPEFPLTPGGIAGHRDPKLDPSFWDTDTAPQLQELVLSKTTRTRTSSFHADVAQAGHVGSLLAEDRRPGTPEQRPTDQLQRLQTSPTSVASLDVMSCSFPARTTKAAPAQIYSAHPLTAHPVDPSSIYTPTDPVASTPRALTGKRVRPSHPHRRNVSQSDSLHDHGSRDDKVNHKNLELVVTMPYAGSLVRGNLLPPGQAFVDMGPPSTARDSRHTILQESMQSALKEKPSGSAMSSQGMRRLMGSVRKALRTRGGNTAASHSDFILLNSNTSRGVTTNRVPGTAVIPRSYDRLTGLQHPIRVDLLGATVADHFKEAVREENSIMSRDSQGRAHAAKGGAEESEYSPAIMDNSDNVTEHGYRPFSDAGITMGSKSIVIVDGTMPLDFATMAGAIHGTIPGFNNSAYSLSDDHMAASDLHLTPPTTPPGNGPRGNTPRRSSFILSQHVHQPSVASDPLPPFVPDLATLGRSPASEDAQDAASIMTATRNSEHRSRFVSQSNRQSTRKPPSSFTRHHRRQMSSRSYRSKGSLAHRRWVSIHSAMGAESVRSFDATSYSGASVVSEVMPPPLRVLRRRPGGDLRGVENVTDLDGPVLHRSRSDGSLTTYSESCRSPSFQIPRRNSSGFVDIVSGDYSHYRSEVFSLGAMADHAPKSRNTHFNTHSSKPIMRPSFEAEAQKLAQIPDDVDDDGGVESALLKLEGRYEKRPPRLSIDQSATPVGDEPHEYMASDEVGLENQQHRHKHVGEEAIGLVNTTAGATAQISLLMPRRSDVTSFLSEASRESYNSIPLLDRDLTPEGRRVKESRQWTDKSVLVGPDTPQDEHPDAFEALPAHPSHVESTRGRCARKDLRAREIHSFLDCASDGASGISSELSGEECLGLEGQPKFSTIQYSLGEEAPVTAEQAPETSTTNLIDLPSPPISLRQALALDPEAAMVPALQDRQIWSQKRGTASANNTSDLAMYHDSLDRADLNVQSGLRHNEMSNQRLSIHLPFILAFDSEILAQQFTLIEKDALNEIDWRELIEMRWKHDNTDPRSWVEFLRNHDTRGVEVVIARFNIMVKWVISEIVLTQSVDERSQCIQKYLHIASHCRKYRNFATMSQIAIALTSNEIARLSRTWNMIPQADLRTMAELEMLVSPTKNFYNLRAEMEGACNTLDLGCIPFVGIYTHDLLFNAQRPSEVASSPTTPALVNFERCRIAASIVKTLLRLLEASTQYYFQPVEGIIERCLWMGALSDDQIRKHSELLE